MVERAVERVDDLDQSVDGAIVSGARRDARLGPDRCDDRELVLHRIEDRHDARTHKQHVRSVEARAIRRGEVLHQAHGIVSEVAEDARRHGRQPRRDGDAALRDQEAQGRKSIVLALREDLEIGKRAISCARPLRTEQEIRVEADHRIAAPRGPAFHRFEQESVLAVCRELQKRGDRRFQIGHEARPEKLGFAALVSRGEALERGLDLHQAG
jgi:hypothetical protein